MKFIKWDMLFPAKLTSLINTRGLIDSASLENHHNNRRNSGSHKWPKTFLGWCISLFWWWTVVYSIQLCWRCHSGSDYPLSPSTALSCSPWSPRPDSTMHPMVCAGYTRESLWRDLRNNEQWLRVKAIHILILCHGHHIGLYAIM